MRLDYFGPLGKIQSPGTLDPSHSSNPPFQKGIPNRTACMNTTVRSNVLVLFSPVLEI